jgi:hypothetical protein
MFSPLLYSLFTHDCVASHISNSIIKFPDDTTVVGLITNNDETVHREEVRALSEWYQENNQSLNANKTKELIVKYRRQQREHAPIHIDGASSESVKSFKFLCMHITDNLKWSIHTNRCNSASQAQEAEGIMPLRNVGKHYSFISTTIFSCANIIEKWFSNDQLAF